MELLLESVATNMNSRLQLTTTNKGVIWFDQVSLMPSDTYKVCFCIVDCVYLLFSLTKERHYIELQVRYKLHS